MLDNLEATMVNIQQAETGLPNVIRVTAYAALLLIDKYISLTNECELYQIAIGTYYNQFYLWFLNSYYLVICTISQFLAFRLGC